MNSKKRLPPYLCKMDQQLRDLLEEKFALYSAPEFFIGTDPLQIPHRFSVKEDIEIAGFLTATIAWGQRKSIITNSLRLLSLMDDNPYHFLINGNEKDWKRFENFVHRTFNGTDCITFMSSLKRIYQHHGGLEAAFSGPAATMAERISNFRNIFFAGPHLTRTRKHVADPLAGSTAKRICMYLRWMVRPAGKGADFGIWKNISPSELCLPLDVHVGRVARSLGLLTRRQDDWKTVLELTSALCQFDPEDPCKYDYALFGLGAFGDLTSQR